MSRSGYVDDLDDWTLIRWRGQVASATRGKRGQKFFTDLLNALEALPERALIADELKDEDGSVCAIGALGLARGVDLGELDPEDYESIASTFDIAEPLAREVMAENDEWYSEKPGARYERMKKWAASQIKTPPKEEQFRSE